MSESQATRQLILDRVREMGEDAREAIMVRLEGSHWYVQRNLLALLAAMPTVPPGLQVQAYAHHEEPASAWRRCKLLARMPARREDAIHTALSDPDTRVVMAALDAAAAGLPRRSTLRVLQILEKSEPGSELRVRGMALLKHVKLAAARDWLLPMVVRTRGMFFWRRSVLQPRTPEMLAALRVIAAAWTHDPKVCRRAPSRLAVGRRAGARRHERRADAMNPAAAFLISLGQCLSTMSLYATGHPARERAIDASFARLLEVLGNIQFAEFSILEGGVVFQGRVIEELRSWDWTSRLAGAGIERLEIDADVTREGWDDALEAMWQQLNGKAPESNDARQQLTASAVRFGSLRVMGGSAEARPDGAAAVAAAPMAEADEAVSNLVLSLNEEISTVTWIHEEVLSGAKVPMAEVEAIVGSMAVAMRANEKLLLPLVMLKEFDEYTTTHACNVSMLSMGLAEAMGCSRSETRAFGVAGLLHDIGKVKIPKDILNKPGRLTDEEREVMASHPTEGARILLQREKGMQMAAVVAFEHHICIDGKGYPRMHFERGCHLASRLVHVCDIYDALSTNRPYRKPWSVEQVLNYLEEKSGSEVDPEVARTFATMVRSSTITEVPMPTDEGAGGA